VLVVSITCLSGVVFAQSPAPEPSAQVVELKALVFALQTKLADTEKELGEEKARRAALEQAELIRARETLDPAIKRKLGLPVPEASKPAEKPVPPQTPPK
jgi:hypothetical protein